MLKRKPSTLQQRGDALAEALFRYDGPPLKLPTPAQRRAQTRRNAAVSLAACKKRYEKGEKAALLRAIDRCAAAGVPIPDWAAKAFEEKYRAVVYRFETSSWDDVFGKPRDSAAKLSARRQRRELQLPVYDRVSVLKGETGKSNDEVFRRVAAEFGIGEPTVKRYYEDYVRFFWSAEPDKPAKSVQKSRR
jgi:hypothetical protein